MSGLRMMLKEISCLDLLHRGHNRDVESQFLLKRIWHKERNKDVALLLDFWFCALFRRWY